MVKIGEYIKASIKEEGRSIKWLAEKLEINYKTLSGKLTRDSLSAEELFKISVLIGIDLEDMKCELDYESGLIDDYVYGILENISEEELFAREEILVRKIRVRGNICIGSEDLIKSTYLFVPINNNIGHIEYKLELFEDVHLIAIGDKEEYMIKPSSDNNEYETRKVNKIPGNMRSQPRSNDNNKYKIRKRNYVSGNMWSEPRSKFYEIKKSNQAPSNMHQFRK